MNYLSRFAAAQHPLPGAVPGFLPIGLPGIMMNFQVGFLQNPLGLNPYTYVLSNPLKFLDPLGLENKDPEGSGVKEQVSDEFWVASWAVGAAKLLVAGLRALGEAAFSRGGFLNSNQYLRVGFGRDGGNRVFRIAGKIDIWRGGPL